MQNKSLLYRVIRAVAPGAAGLLIFVGGIVFLGLHLNDRAREQATALCSQIKPGITEDAALAIAGKTGAHHLSATDKHEFRFQGWVFNATSCEIAIQAGKVAAVSVMELDD